LSRNIPKSLESPGRKAIAAAPSPQQTNGETVFTFYPERALGWLNYHDIELTQETTF